MFETVVGFLAVLGSSWIILAGLFLLGAIFEFAEWRGFAVFTALVAGVAAYFFFKVPFLDLLMYAGGYLAFGLVWSFWRYKRYVDKHIEAYKKDNTSQRGGMDYLIEKLKPSNMWSTIVAWVFVWPFSMIENLLGDVFRIVETLVKKVFRGVYNRIYQSAISALRVGK